MNTRDIIGAIVFATVLNFSLQGMAEETTVEKIEAQKNKSVDKVTNSYDRTTEDLCEMEHGKMKCVGKKIKNRTNELGQKIKTKTKEIKNKVD